MKNYDTKFTLIESRMFQTAEKRENTFVDTLPFSSLSLVWSTDMYSSD